MKKAIKENEVVETTTKSKKGKNAVISISVSEEEKQQISVEALKDYGISVSELIRNRMFVKPEENKECPDVKVYKDVIEQQKVEILELKKENATLKSSSLETVTETEPKAIEEKETAVSNDNSLTLNFTQPNEGKGLLEVIKGFKKEQIEELTESEKSELYPDFEKYSNIEMFGKLIFLRGLKRSYNYGLLVESTGLKNNEVEEFAELEGINYSDEV